jgi:hypothetical protein
MHFCLGKMGQTFNREAVMQGDLVIVRSYGGVPLVRRVWEEDKRGVYITDDVHFKLLATGESSVLPVGFPRQDVFRYDPSLAELVTLSPEACEWRWDSLTRY